jgi:hypothetical protein
MRLPQLSSLELLRRPNERLREVKFPLPTNTITNMPPRMSKDVAV